MSEVFDSKSFLKTVTSQPGVYRMYDASGTVIYVGKAKDLKKRLSSYFRSNLASRKTEALVAQIQNIDVTVTHTETEALLLEHNYIKLYQPRYNVLLRDDKSYPYIFLSGDTHPRLAIHRGAKHAKGEYFGPFPNGYAVRETLALLQKIFPIRQCENSVYRNRSRPCLQYQIGRCLGPCVEGLVSEEDYAQQVEYVRLFLAGKDDQVINQLVSRMEQASQNLAFEEAARLRDQIQAVRRVTEKQFVSNNGDDLDVIGVAFESGMACLHVLFIRQGKVLGSRSYYPKVPNGTELAEVVETFVGQFYLQGSQMRTLPGEILLDFPLTTPELLAETLTEIAGRRVNVQTRPRGDRARYLKLARTNAATALTTRLSQQSTISQRLTALAQALQHVAAIQLRQAQVQHQQRVLGRTQRGVGVRAVVDVVDHMPLPAQRGAQAGGDVRVVFSNQNAHTQRAPRAGGEGRSRRPGADRSASRLRRIAANRVKRGRLLLEL